MTPEKIAEQKLLAEQDKAFYEKIWAIRPHFCQVCTNWLGNILNKMFFDHILEKSKYKHLRYEGKNIILICSDCHAKKSVGHPLPRHKEIIEETKRIFGI